MDEWNLERQGLGGWAFQQRGTKEQVWRQGEAWLGRGATGEGPGGGKGSWWPEAPKLTALILSGPGDH